MSKRVQDSNNVPSTEKLDTESKETNLKTNDVDGEYVQPVRRLKQNSAASWLEPGTNGEAGARLLALCQRGDWLGVESLLKRVNKDDIPPDLADEKTGYTPLMYAVKENRVVFVERFLELGLNVNARTKDGLTALHLAASHTRETIIQLLLSKRADPTITGGAKDQLPIHVLCARPTGAAIAPLQMLLRSSSKNMRLWLDKDGNIPFLLAVESGNHGVCRELMSFETREQLIFRRQKTGDIALHIATRRHDVDLVRYLLESGSPVNEQNHEGQTALHIVAAEGDEALAKLFSIFNANPNIPDKQDRTPLHLATELGHTSMVELLTDKLKASIFYRTKDGSTLLHIASAAGHPETAMIFMKKGVPLHMSNKAGAKCIHTAAQKGYVNVVRALIQKGENVDVTTNDNLTALHIAIQAGKWEVLETLLGHGANVNLPAGKNGATPLHMAAMIPSGEKSAELLLKSGANINARQKDNETPLHLAVRHGNLRTVELLLEDGAEIQSQTEFGETALHIGVKNCRFQVVKCLLMYWASTFSGHKGLFSVNQQNQKGETALHYAAALTPTQHHYIGESRDIVKIILQNGGNVTIETTEWKETPLHYCSRAGNVESMRVILESLEPSDLQALSNRKSKNGWSPLLYASNGGHFDVVNLLIQNNARVDVFDEHGKAALHLAAENGHQEIVDFLIHHKAFVNVRSKKGYTSLHLAARNGHNAIVRDLIHKYGSVVDAFSLTKQTALHLAAERGNLDVCNTLLDANANASSTDNDGQSPLLLAAQNDHSEVVKLFLRHQPQLVSVANTKGFTCAHMAAVTGSTAVVKELMKSNRGVVISARTKKTNETALHLAADSGHAEVVRDLLKAGASSSEENADGNTPLHLAAKQGHLGVLEELKTAVNWKSKSKKTGLTALHVAAIHGQSDFVREMLTQVPAAILSDPPSEDNTVLDDDGYTPLHLAAQFGRENVVRMLLNSDGVRTDTPTTAKGTIPLHLAAQGGHMSVVGLLLSRGTELLQATDRTGRTPLHLAAANGHKDMLGLLLGQNADINAADNNGWTALHYTACGGYLEAVQFLIESGASSLSKTKEGKVSLSFAAANGHHEVLSFLLRSPHDSYSLMTDKTFLMDLMTCAKTHNNKPMLEFVLLSPAPIEIAVKVARQYQNLALKEKERYCDLEYMSSFCDSIASDLMTVTAASNLTPTLLRALDVNQTAFMDVLIEQERKEVVSHPSVQKYLTELWMGGIDWPQWRIVLLFLVFLLFPIVWILCSLPFGHRLPNIPIIKFLSYLISHIFFVVLLSFTIINPWVPLWRNTNLIPQWHESLLIVWVIGMVLSHITNPKEKGGFAWTRVIVMSFCMLSIFVHCSAIFIAEMDTKLVLLYIRNQLLGVSLLLCFLEFLNFLSFHHLFGPWAVIIKDLMKDLLRFLAILALFLVGFSLHLSSIYQPVFEPIYLANASLPTFGQEFQSPINTFEMLFFALFGLVEPDYMPPLYLSPSFSKIIIKVVFGVYMTVTVVVLINLLIAMMSNTYQRIQARSDTEWKFGRAKLIRRMIRTSSSPPPVNFFTGFWFMIRKCRRFKVKKARTVRPKERTISVNIPAPVRPVISKGARRRWQMALTSVAGATRSGIEASVFELRENTIARAVDWPPIVAKFLQTKGIVEMSPVFRKE